MGMARGLATVLALLGFGGSAQGEQVVYSNGSSITIINGKVLGGSVVQGVGPLKEESRTLAPFRSIRLEGSVNVVFTSSPKTSLRLVAQQNIFPLIVTSSGGGVLRIGSRGSYSTSAGITVHVTGPSLSSASVSGSGNITASDLKGDNFEALVMGSGDITLSGQVDSASLTVMGSGDIDARDLRAHSLHVGISGSGDAEAYASKSVDVSVAGSGSARIFGNPANRKVDRTGSGEVRFK